MKTIISARELVELHFNRKVEQQEHNIVLSEKEHTILFMLIAGYTQQEIADYLKHSRSYILKVIQQNLCKKFNLSLNSTKLLVDKAVHMGYSHLVPQSFL